MQVNEKSILVIISTIDRDEIIKMFATIEDAKKYRDQCKAHPDIVSIDIYDEWADKIN